MFDELQKLLQDRSDRSLDGLLLNFEVGRLVQGLIKERGEEIVREIAAATGSSELFLFNAALVYRRMQYADRIKWLHSRMHGKLSWRFLVDECSPARTGALETEAFWDAKLSQVERAIGDIQKIGFSLEDLPHGLQAQFGGVVVGACDMALQGIAADGAQEPISGPFKVAHFADLHFDDKLSFGGRLRLDPATGMNVRLLDIHNSMSRAVDRIIEEQCALCLITEPFEVVNTSKNEDAYFLHHAQRIAQHMPVIVEPGNHGISYNTRDASALEPLKGRPNIFVIERPTILYLEGRTLRYEPSSEWGALGTAKIFVLPFPSRSIVGEGAENISIRECNRIASQKLKLQLEFWRGELDPKAANVVLFHGGVEGCRCASSEKMTEFEPVIHPDDLRGFQYAALGHDHIHQQVAPNAWYPGSLERRDFTDEPEEKGFIIATLDGQKPAEVEFVPNPHARSYKTLSPEFFFAEGWEETLDPETIYRIRGTVSREDAVRLKAEVSKSPVPILEQQTVRREAMEGTAELNQDMSMDDVVKTCLEEVERPASFVELCLELHAKLRDRKDLSEALGASAEKGATDAPQEPGLFPETQKEAA